MADDFRKRRIEKGLTREQVAEKSGVALSNIVRFEQKGLISLKNLIGIAMVMEYTSEEMNTHDSCLPPARFYMAKLISDDPFASGQERNKLAGNHAADVR